MGSLLRRLTPAIGLVLVLGACGTTADTAAPTPAGDDTAAPDTTGEDTDGGAAAGACPEGTEDCVDADLDGGDLEPPVDGAFDVEAARRDAESLLGATEEDLEIWGDVRVGRVGEEEYSTTMDLVPGRKTVELDEDDEGVLRVTSVTLELPDGDTETFE
ncbi:hypothetical protein [Egicoccus halophilus]|uniref:Uncharacterized protein n=1 Tax=Egicoccus halophilus TaxID=1670830 RepID=A0A8J3AAC6_9ACTN|nr:hypothetical protein [Egicoccus halophilus]GGI08484.1 hypothetical protein GCM10011354_29310 [Egicoccus halophilus]